VLVLKIPSPASWKKKTETKTIEKKISKAGYYKDKKKQTTAKDKRRGLQRKNG